MRVAKDQVEVKMEIPGAIIRQRKNFGDMNGLGQISGEYFTLATGVDTTELFIGLKGDRCQCPHWGYVMKGRLRITYADREEILRAGDVYYMPAGHTGVAEEDTDFLEIAPPEQHQQFIENALRNLAAAQPA